MILIKVPAEFELLLTKEALFVRTDATGSKGALGIRIELSVGPTYLFKKLKLPISAESNLMLSYQGTLVSSKWRHTGSGFPESFFWGFWSFWGFGVAFLSISSFE